MLVTQSSLSNLKAIICVSGEKLISGCKFKEKFFMWILEQGTFNNKVDSVLNTSFVL